MTIAIAEPRAEGSASAEAVGTTRDRLREPLLLALLLGLPLAFNPFGTLGFDPFKLTLVRLAALALLLALAGRLWRSGSAAFDVRSGPARRLVIAIGAGVLGLHQIGDSFGVAFLLSLILGLPLSAAIALLGHHVRGIEFLASRSIVYGTL